MRTQQTTRMSEEEYLEFEARSPVRHEYVAGEIHAMTGASLRHNVIALNLASLLRAHLRGTPCRVFMSDAKLRVGKAAAYYYPDVIVTCEPRLQTLSAEEVAVQEPRVVIEVLSPATEGTDRREKLHAYRTLPSLREYVLVAQDAPRIEVHRRTGDLAWEVALLGAGDPVELPSLEFSAPLETVYEEAGVEMPPPQAM